MLMRMGVAVAMMVVMVMLVVVAMIMMVMIVIMIARLEKVGLDVEDAIEVEGAPPQDFRQRKRAAHGAVHLGVGIDAADARLDLGKLVGGDEVRLVDDDHVREG